MQHSEISFETWLANHSEDHEAKWCRELYPWEVFNSLNYDISAVSLRQNIRINEYSYIVTIKQRTIGKYGRLNFLIHLQTGYQDTNKQAWEIRKWDDLFHLVMTTSGKFITLYSDQKDPSKVLLRLFLNTNGGTNAIAKRLAKIQNIRSLNISNLLFDSLISYSSYDAYPNLNQWDKFLISDQDDTVSDLTSETYIPFLSNNRELWVICSFSEEKAHRLALSIRKQARKIIIVYIQPTFTRHHRCIDEAVSIVSISQFLRMLSPSIHRRYINQARFLINHLRLREKNLFDKSDSDTLIQDIQKQKEFIPIYTSDLRVAKSGLSNIVVSTGDTAYVLACANLINAAMNKNLNAYKGTVKLSKEVYNFKSILCEAIENIIKFKPANVSIYIEETGLIYINILGVQFSFHNIPITPTLQKYILSKKNQIQEWSGIRLQPISPLVLDWAEAILYEEEKSKNFVQ
tara:strand:+ start:729 stop:2108 length:1380 start_codon:yes stop_codon:yes gene_type:complete